MSIAPSTSQPAGTQVTPATVAVLIPSAFTAQLRSRLGPEIQVVDVLGGAELPAEPAGPVMALVMPWSLREPSVPASALEAVERAEWVHFVSTGVDGFPLDLLAGRTVTCGRGANSAAIAEVTVSLLLAVEKRIPEIWEARTNESFITEPLGTLDGRTVGLLGFGSIARELAARLGGFGTRLLALRRSGRPADVPGVTVVRTLAELLGEADHLVVAAPLTPETDRLLDDDAFALAKPGLHLVNVARGRIVDTDALVRALAAGTVARASLDVTDPEPLPADHPLRDDPRVRIMPHLSWSAPGGLNRGLDVFADNLHRWRAGRPLDGLVDLTAGY
ncbi:phosphoglycerate dehydrogenase-like oxidoreductase [Frankia sp. EI5c]|uniref:NAD(P)-dependent oxidoreductase n=1 Tax=Frankia sp. EI5c TaxID=683316 RepID=UPI0007C3AAD0|nr:NAD(P)-dependent oxidoreductase [Frankia sp. EI5c]OAA19598.1 phosphoglycerate dehydrogenase-like oxidoreductase [Frankia sp. EI5c]